MVPISNVNVIQTCCLYVLEKFKQKPALKPNVIPFSIYNIQKQAVDKRSPWYSEPTYRERLASLLNLLLDRRIQALLGIQWPMFLQRVLEFSDIYSMSSTNTTCKGNCRHICSNTERCYLPDIVEVTVWHPFLGCQLLHLVEQDMHLELGAQVLQSSVAEGFSGRT